ncbi:hypothetical protein HRbin10_02579 [bacterium HR10]|nr:hypothetical protein HRbin10_02579 [bacterium HR10]
MPTRELGQIRRDGLIFIEGEIHRGFRPDEHARLLAPVVFGEDALGEAQMTIQALDHIRSAQSGSTADDRDHRLHGEDAHG